MRQEQQKVATSAAVKPEALFLQHQRAALVPSCQSLFVSYLQRQNNCKYNLFQQDADKAIQVLVFHEKQDVIIKIRSKAMFHMTRVSSWKEMSVYEPWTTEGNRIKLS